MDGSEWKYSDWMPGHPNIHTDKPVCVEMFKDGKNYKHINYRFICDLSEVKSQFSLTCHT